MQSHKTAARPKIKSVRVAARNPPFCRFAPEQGFGIPPDRIHMVRIHMLDHARLDPCHRLRDFLRRQQVFCVEPDRTGKSADEMRPLDRHPVKCKIAEICVKPCVRMPGQKPGPGFRLLIRPDLPDQRQPWPGLRVAARRGVLDQKRGPGIRGYIPWCDRIAPKTEKSAVPDGHRRTSPARHRAICPQPASSPMPPLPVRGSVIGPDLRCVGPSWSSPECLS